jgi:hypothetical protein
VAISVSCRSRRRCLSNGPTGAPAVRASLDPDFDRHHRAPLRYFGVIFLHLIV